MLPYHFDTATADSRSFLEAVCTFLDEIADRQKQMIFVSTVPRRCPPFCLVVVRVRSPPLSRRTVSFPTLRVSQTAACPVVVGETETVWVLAGTAAVWSRQWRPCAAGGVTFGLSGSDGGRVVLWLMLNLFSAGFSHVYVLVLIVPFLPVLFCPDSVGYIQLSLALIGDRRPQTTEPT